LKVCILTTSFPRFKGDSAGIFIYHLSRWLVKKGVNIEVIAPHDPGCHFTEKWENIRIRRFPYFYPFQLQKLCYGSGIVKNIKNNLPAILQLPFLCVSEFFYSLAFFKKNKPDIIHAHWSLPQGLIGIIAKRIFKIPCVTSIHGSDVYGLRSAFFKALNTMVIRNSDACTANSMATARIARKVCGNENIKVLPMGVDTECFSKIHDVASLKRKFKIEGPVILFVGRLIDWKGTAYLIKAMPEIIQRFPAAKALMIGSGPEKAELMRLAGAIGVANHIIFIDEVPQEELVPFYSMADIFVLPSIVNENGETEGLGVVLLEAMACELPVIGSDVGGIPDIIRNGETGLLVRQKDSQDLVNQIIRLLTDEDLRKKMVRNSRNLIETQFSWEVVAERFIEIYLDVLEDNRSEVEYKAANNI
jgi:glycosyltransferase involved in cell wall biosynthesis